MSAHDPVDFWRAAVPLAATHGLTALMTGGDSEERSTQEVAAIVALLPALGPADLVLEPAAGAGRFTVELARRAGRVMAWDLVPEFVAENRRRCADLDHVTVGVADARALELPKNAALVFVKWLLMYMPDDVAARLIARFVDALRPGGSLFIHESCDSAEHAPVGPTALWTGEFLGATYRAYYRPAAWYCARLLERVNDPRATMAEFDLETLYLPGEGGGQRAWLLTLPRGDR